MHEIRGLLYLSTIWRQQCSAALLQCFVGSVCSQEKKTFQTDSIFSIVTILPKNAFFFIVLRINFSFDSQVEIKYRWRRWRHNVSIIRSSVTKGVLLNVPRLLIWHPLPVSQKVSLEESTYFWPTRGKSYLRKVMFVIQCILIKLYLASHINKILLSHVGKSKNWNWFCSSCPAKEIRVTLAELPRVVTA